MKAISVSAPGGPEALAVVETANPTPAPGEVIVELAAAGVNYIDTYQREGLYPMALPFTPGLEGAGTVLEIGEQASGWAVGDRVAWTTQIGSYAQRVAVAADKLVAVPGSVPLETAAAVMLQGVTAHYLATDTYPLGGGDRCLIHAGAGGVGLLLIQIAKRRGAEVFTTVSTQDKAALAAAAGADHVIRYDQRDFADAVTELAGDRPLHVVYDGVGAATFDRGLTVLRRRGTLVLFGQASGPVPPVNLQVLAANGSLFTTRPTMGDYIATPAELTSRTDDLFSWIAAGELDVRVGQTWPLEEAGDAHRALEARLTTGKTLLLA
ncbi:MAG: quinone oxidoreductase [Acidimicrobiia bacterium]|nr:quinone oxidoreductase [Acidimicrobiia bacterium]